MLRTCCPAPSPLWSSVSIHFFLAAAGYNPPELVFPVSVAILRNIDGYRQVLESYSRPLLEVVEWRAKPDGNVEVVGDTADFTGTSMRPRTPSFFTDASRRPSRKTCHERSLACRRTTVLREGCNKWWTCRRRR